MIYVDTSALMKLAFPEAETEELKSYLRPSPPLVSSDLVLVEARRSAIRRSPARLPHVDVLLTQVETIGMGAAVLESASRMPQPFLRALDAIHLATATLIGGELDAFLTYDKRLAEAARDHGLKVVSPAATPASP